MILSIVLIITGIIIRLDVKNRPIQFDESSYSYTALNILYNGEKYLDRLDNKPIGTFYLYIIFVKIFGNHYYTFHLVSALSDIIIILLAFLIGLKIYNLRLAILSAAIYSIMFVPFSTSYSGFIEPPMMVFTLLSIYFYFSALSYNGSSKYILLVIAGICSAISFHIKQPGILILFSYIIHQPLLSFYKLIPIQTSIKNIVSLISGFLIITLPLYVYFIVNDIFFKYIYAIFFYSLGYESLLPKTIWFLTHLFFTIPFLLILSCTSIILFYKTRNIFLSFLYINFIIVMVFFSLTTDFQSHYLIQVILIMIFLSVNLLFNLKTLSFKQTLAVILILLMLFSYNLLYTIGDVIINDPNTIDETNGDTDKRLRIFGPFKLSDGYHDVNLIHNLGFQMRLRDYLSKRLNQSDKIISTFLGFNYLLNKSNNYKIHYFTPMFIDKFNVSDFPNYASESKFLIYLNYQEDREYISKNFIDCINEVWKFIPEISNWHVKVYENTNPILCRNIW